MFDFVYTLASANNDQSLPNLATIYLPIRSRMSSIMEQIKPEHPELFALEFGKIAETDFVYTLASPNIYQSAPNSVSIKAWSHRACGRVTDKNSFYPFISVCIRFMFVSYPVNPPLVQRYPVISVSSNGKS